MKTSLAHLPDAKRAQITAIAALIQAEVNAEQIILFGSHARGDWVVDETTGYRSDYDLLVIVAQEGLARDSVITADLWQRLRAIGDGTPVSVIVHHVKEVNQEIRAGQYFFIDIVREGIVLFDAKRVMLARPKALGGAERLALARTHFAKWFASASGFWQIAGHCMARDLLPHAAFLLHQTAERYFHAALLVFTGYKLRTHDLAELAKQSGPLHPALAGALPRDTKEDERLFVLLRKAYIEARYAMNYRISMADLEALRTRTLDLGARVREACVAQLGVLGAEDPEAGVPSVPSAEDVGELGEAPPIEQPEALRVWMDARAVVTFERGKAEGIVAGKAQGIEEGVARGKAEALLAVLAARGLDVSVEVRAVIEGCKDAEVLGRWIARAMTAWSAAEVVDAR
ncbi:MAG: HEPN domain-containing protein [Minicystis sp.]